MPRTRGWVFTPDRGGTPIPEPVRRRTQERIRRYAEQHFAGCYTRLEIRFHGQFCYIDAYTEPAPLPGDWPPADWPETREEYLERLRNTPTKLCRLRYFGGEERWGFAFYTYSNERYELSVFPSGGFSARLRRPSGSRPGRTFAERSRQRAGARHGRACVCILGIGMRSTTMPCIPPTWPAGQATHSRKERESLMAERVDKPQLVQRVARRLDRDGETVGEIVDGFLEEIYAALKGGDSVSLRGFGSFYVRAERDSWVFKFNPSQRLRALFGWSSSYRGPL